MITTETTAFDDVAWRAACEAAADEAAKRSSQSHDIYVDRLSAAVDGLVARLPQAHQATALEIARGWDYATRAEREEGQRWNASHGFCSHGIELGCCPAGCDDDDDDDGGDYHDGGDHD